MYQCTVDITLQQNTNPRAMHDVTYIRTLIVLVYVYSILFLMFVCLHVSYKSLGKVHVSNTTRI